MAKTKTSAAVKNRYAAKAYDRLAVIVPKGQKATIEAFAQKTDDSINGVVSKAVLSYMGLQDWPELQAENDRDSE